jgi:hypothetical protein
LLAALSTEVLTIGISGWPKWSTQILALICGCAAAILAQSTFFAPLPGSVLEPFRAFRGHAEVLFHPSTFVRRLDQEREAIRNEQRLPELRKLIGSASVDVFGQFQAYAFDNGLSYAPRPVPQSYNACDRTLMALNETYYISDARPRFVLFELLPLDEKFPPLEDALLLRALLTNYRLAGRQGRFLLLEANSAVPVRLTQLEKGFARIGQKIDLSKFGDVALWVEIDIRPSLIGSLRQKTYASPVVRLAAYRDDNHTLVASTSAATSLITRRRAPPSMLAAGFLATPLVLNTDDVAKLLSAKPIVRPAAYSVEPTPGQEKLWQQQITYRVFRIENPFPSAPLRS